MVDQVESDTSVTFVAPIIEDMRTRRLHKGGTPSLIAGFQIPDMHAFPVTLERKLCYPRRVARKIVGEISPICRVKDKWGAGGGPSKFPATKDDNKLIGNINVGDPLKRDLGGGRP